jgi:hypothetical protein
LDWTLLILNRSFKYYSWRTWKIFVYGLSESDRNSLLKKFDESKLTADAWVLSANKYFEHAKWLDEQMGGAFPTPVLINILNVLVQDFNYKITSSQDHVNKFGNKVSSTWSLMKRTD